MEAKNQKKLTELDRKFKNYLETKKSLEDGKFYFEQCNNDREVEHYEMKISELTQSPDGLEYQRLRQEILKEM